MAVRVLKDHVMESNEVLPMEEAIEVVEEAFRELGEGRAKIAPRRRIHVEEGGPETNENVWYWFNQIAGAVPGFDTMALRINSGLRELAGVDDDRGLGETQMTYPGNLVGLVLVFDIHSCELTAILDDRYVSPIRVAATSAIGTDRLARADAESVAMIGSGEQARAHATALAEIRDIDFMTVYSPTRDHRESFAAHFDATLDATVRAVDDPQKAVQGADIVNLATSAVDPVIDGSWLEPGMHINSIVGGDHYKQRQEIDDETVRRADRIVVNSFEQVILDKQGDLYPRLETGLVAEDDIDELADLVHNEIPGRTTERQITLLKNNTGMGIQFAATAARILENVEGTDLGEFLPSELFLTERSPNGN